MSDLLTINEAAPRLGVSPRALRARCRRNQKREKGEVVARLGAGVVAYKFGVSWRISFKD